MAISVTSSAFNETGMIPTKYTCDGKDVSPQLAWAGIPVNAQSVALICDDPDAPVGTWVHWVVYNIPTDTNGLPETSSAEGLPPGILQGLNDWQQAGYQGPCPPIGNHRYYFKLYALDTVLPDLKHPAKSALEKSMRGHIIARSELVGRYQRQ